LVTTRRMSLVSPHWTTSSGGGSDSPHELNIPKFRGSDSSSDSDDFKMDDSIDDDFLKKKSLEFMMYNNKPLDSDKSSEDEEKDNKKSTPFGDQEEMSSVLNRWREAESDSDDDDWLEDEKDDEKDDDLKSPNQILQEKIGFSSEPSEDVPAALNSTNSGIKHFEESSDEEDWFKDNDSEKESSIIEPIVKKGERASEIESQTKLHVRNDISTMDNSEVKIEINSEHDISNKKLLVTPDDSKSVTLKLPPISKDDDDDDFDFDDDSSESDKKLGRESSVSEINLDFPEDSDSDSEKKTIKDIGKAKSENLFDKNMVLSKMSDEGNGDSRLKEKSKSSLAFSKQSNNDEESDPWYSDEEDTPKKTTFLETDVFGGKKEDSDSDTDGDDWYSESEDDKKKNPFANFFDAEVDSPAPGGVPKLGFGNTGITSFIGSQSDTARRIKEAENLTLDELITDLTDVTKLKKPFEC